MTSFPRRREPIQLICDSVILTPCFFPCRGKHLKPGVYKITTKRFLKSKLARPGRRLGVPSASYFLSKAKESNQRTPWSPKLALLFALSPGRGQNSRTQTIGPGRRPAKALMSQLLGRSSLPWFFFWDSLPFALPVNAFLPTNSLKCHNI